jgi:hypothetical protein
MPEAMMKTRASCLLHRSVTIPGANLTISPSDKKLFNRCARLNPLSVMYMIAVRFILFWTKATMSPFFPGLFLDQGDRVAVIYIFLKSLNPHFTPTRLACSI